MARGAPLKGQKAPDGRQNQAFSPGESHHEGVLDLLKGHGALPLELHLVTVAVGHGAARSGREGKPKGL